MGINYKGKQGKLNVKQEVEAVYNPIYLKFNFSYMHQDCFEITAQQSANLTQTILGLSNRPWLQIMSEGKATGFESIPLKSFSKIKMTEPVGIDSDYKFEIFDRKLSNKRDVFRIKNTQTGRMIGKIYRTTFYVFYLDFEGKAYNHGS